MCLENEINTIILQHILIVGSWINAALVGSEVANLSIYQRATPYTSAMETGFFGMEKLTRNQTWSRETSLNYQPNTLRQDWSECRLWLQEPWMLTCNHAVRLLEVKTFMTAIQGSYRHRRHSDHRVQTKTRIKSIL